MAGSNGKTRAQSLTRSNVPNILSISLRSAIHGSGIACNLPALNSRHRGRHRRSLFANLQEAAYDYAGLRQYPWLGKTLLRSRRVADGLSREHLAGFPGAEVSPEKAVAARAFPVLIICDAEDHALPVVTAK